MNPEQVLEPYADCLMAHQITNVVHTLTVPFVILRAIGAGMLRHRQRFVRHEAVNLLLVMMRQFSRFVASIEKGHLIDDATQKLLKQNVMKVRSSISLLIWQLVITHKIDHTEIHALLDIRVANTPFIKMLCPQKNCLSYLHKNITCLSVGMLRIGQVVCISCKIECRCFLKDCYFMSNIMKQ